MNSAYEPAVYQVYELIKQTFGGVYILFQGTLMNDIDLKGMLHP